MFCKIFTLVRSVTKGRSLLDEYPISKLQLGIKYWVLKRAHAQKGLGCLSRINDNTHKRRYGKCSGQQAQ
jgi:hypothetical protein